MDKKPVTTVGKCAALSAILIIGTICTQAFAEDRVFDELRFGVSGSVNSSETFEAGIFPSATVFFDPFDGKTAANLAQSLLEPRIYLGLSASTTGGASQAYAGFSWTAPVTEKFFLEVGLGGTVHNGDLKDDGSDGPKLGCRLLFREYAAAGYRFTEHWQVLATIDHSSHANLCDGPNNGLTHAGLALGYKF